MFIETKHIRTQYTRVSKLKKSHAYSRVKSVAVFQCDNCESIFERDQGSIDHRRMSNEYFHVCPNCKPKQFAQSKGAERRTMWNLPVDSDKNISDFD
jgi:rubredoxin